jgi:outer membrane receptor protein involved in Fe transport
MSTKFFIDRQQNRLILQIVASIMAIGMAGRTANGQTANAPATAADSGSSTNVTQLGNTTVVGKLDTARNQIVPDLGATVYSVDKTQIDSQSMGENAPFNQVILRMPGTAQDGLGQFHLRGEHANVQYRINDVLLPEGITGFGQELDTRFVDSVRLITGSLPAQYGFRTAGIVDLHTKSGAFEPGGEFSMYGGSYDWLQPSFELGGSTTNWNYFVDGSFTHNNIGIENPTSSTDPIHDTTDQFKGFAYASRILDDTSRISLMGSASYSTFELPNTPGLAGGTSPGGTPWSDFMPTVNSHTNSVNVNENQNEQNYYGVAAYQKSADKLNLQAAAFGRYSGTHFKPDQVGDLFFNGVASDVERHIYSGGVQADLSYELNDKHTLRGGIMALEEVASANTKTTVFPTDAGGDPTGGPFSIPVDTTIHGLFLGAYIQDEWKILPKVTINYGARFDLFYSSFDKENQPSPRVNIIYQPFESTTLHAGYARYFTPPALENLAGTSVAQFDGTSNESEVKTAGAAKAERANYFDLGVSQKVVKGLQLGMDGYYKEARNQLDDGLFGQSLILSQFNYAKGRVYGVEFTGTYTAGGFSTYANIAVSQAQGKNVTSGQFLFGQDDLNFIHNHWVFLDHDQLLTGSFGMSYLLKETESANTRFYVDALYGSGLRTDLTTASGGTIPNGGTVAASYSVNLGAEETFKVGRKQFLKARVDIVNITDNVYELRDGGGIGVNAAQFGMRRAIFGSLSYVF